MVVDTKMHLCGRCKVAKSLSEFHTSQRDGVQSLCKDCKREHRREYSKMPENRARVRLYKNSYKATDKGKAAKYRYKHSNTYKEYLVRIKDKISAWSATHYYRTKWSIKPEPCVVCGEKETEGHHEDYYKPLDVTWLCPEHHRQLHNLRGE